MHEKSTTNHGTSRRSLLVAASWAAPAIAVAIAAPAAAASNSAVATIDFDLPVQLGDSNQPHGTVFDSANNPLAGVQMSFQIIDPDPDIAVFTGNVAIAIVFTNAQGRFFVPLESTLTSGSATITLQADSGSVQRVVTVEVVPD